MVADIESFISAFDLTHELARMKVLNPQSTSLFDATYALKIRPLPLF